MMNNRPVRDVPLFLLDILGYLLVVDFLVFGVAVVVSIVVGGQWAAVEAIMFVIGVLLFGYATMLLWPTSIEDEEDARMDDYTATGQIQAIVNNIPILSAYDDSAKRLPVGLKLFLASILVVFTAFLIERLLVV